MHIKHHSKHCTCRLTFLFLYFFINPIQGGWEHVTVRGNASQAPRGTVPSESPPEPMESEGRGRKGQAERSRTPLMVSERQEVDSNAVNC